MGPTWGPPGADRTQVGPMLDPWTLLSGIALHMCVLLYVVLLMCVQVICLRICLCPNADEPTTKDMGKSTCTKPQQNTTPQSVNCIYIILGHTVPSAFKVYTFNIVVLYALTCPITPAIYQESIVLDKHGQYQARWIDSLSQESITALCTVKLRHSCINHAMETCLTKSLAICMLKTPWLLVWSFMQSL